MASVPLPALAVRPPEPSPNPLEQLQRLQQLKSMGQQQQMQQQDIAIKQQQLTDQQAMTAAMKTADPTSPTFYDDVSKGVLKNGGSANAALAVQQHALTIKKTVSDIAAQDASTGSKNLETFINAHKAVGDALQGIEQVPDDQLHDTAAAKVQELAKAGLLPPQAAQQALQTIQSTPDPNALRTAIDQVAKTSMGAKAVAEQAQAAATTKEAISKNALQEAQLPGAQAESEQKQLEAAAMKQFGGMTQAMADAKYRAIQQQKSLGQSVSAPDAAFGKAYEKQKTLNTQFQFNLQNAGASGGANGEPSETAQAIANGTVKWGDIVSPRTPFATKEALLKQVKALNPQFNSGDFQIEQKVRQDFTSGPAAQNLTAFNTAIEHANQLSKAADALDNGNMLVLNRVGNALGYQFGADKTTNFNVIKNALTGEVSKVFKGGQATDAEIKAVQEPFSNANSPAQLKGAIQNAITLMNSKRDALKQQYEKGVTAQPNFGGSTPAGTSSNVPSFADWKKQQQ